MKSYEYRSYSMAREDHWNEWNGNSTCKVIFDDMMNGTGWSIENLIDEGDER